MKRIPFQLNTLAYSILSICFLFMLWSISTGQIGLDGGFYLAIARNLWEDGVNYFDFASSYNPLGIMLLGIPNFFFENPILLNYSLYFIILIADAILFYKICLIYRENKIQSIFFTSIFLLYALILDGHLIILEPIQLFFIFLAFLQLHKKKLISLGVICFLAFLTKQYSLAFALPIVFFIFQSSESLLKKMTHLLLVVSSVVISAIIFYWLYAQHIDYSYYIKRLLGQVPQMNGLLTNQNGTGEGYGLAVFLKTTLRVLIYCPLLWIPFLVIQRKKTNTFLVVCFFAFSSVLIFASYFHYFILLLPWTLLLLHENIEVEKLKYSLLYATVILAPSLFMLAKTTRSKNTIAHQEKEMSAQLSSYIPQNAKVFIVQASMAQYAICDFNSIDNHFVGYAFPNIIKKSAVLKAMEPGTFLIADNQYLSSTEKELFTEVYHQRDYIIFKKI